MNELDGLDYEGLELDFSRANLQVIKMDGLLSRGAALKMHVLCNA